jgi:hypothetical protein
VLGCLVGALLASLWLTGSAAAEPAPVIADDLAFEPLVGLHLQTDLGTQFVRAGGGGALGRLALLVVLDPKGYTEGAQHDTDVVGEWQFRRQGWGILGGWRWSSLPILGTRYYQEKALAGVSAPLPSVLFGALNVRVGAELAVTIARHGDGIPTFWFWEDERLRGGWINVSLFARVYVGGGR